MGKILVMGRILRWFRQNTLRTIAFGFAGIIIAGSLLLTLPVASSNGVSVGLFDALFTSTSAVCVTGLVVRDTGTEYSRFGHVVIMMLIQTGGLGFMTFATLILRFLGRRITLRERMVIRESMNEDSMNGLAQLIQWVALSTLFIELTGAVLLSFRMIPQFGWGDGIFYSVFHAVSAFCNAGFDLFGGYSSLTRYYSDVLVNLTIGMLIVCGGLGFAVIQDLKKKPRLHQLKLHTKIVLVSYGSAFLVGFLFNLLAEWNNPGTLGPLSVGEKVLAAMFQSVTLRTAGFNTIDQAALNPATKLINSILMFIGASPASTGGGIKVTTFAILILVVRMVVRGESSINVFCRRFDPSMVARAVAIIAIAFGIVLVDVATISLLEPKFHLIDITYECASAMGTVGISSIGSGNLGVVSRILLILTMYLGRIGPLTMALLLAQRQTRDKESIRYPEERIMLG